MRGFGRWWVGVASLVARVAAASPDMPENIPAVDVSAAMRQFAVLDDGQGTLVVFNPQDPLERSFVGNREAVWAMRKVGGGRNGDVSFDIAVFDPRVPNTRAFLSFRDGVYSVECGAERRELRRLPDAEAAKVLSGLRFYEERWQRQMVGFYRDEFGVYYFIDNARAEGATDHRVYIGFQGQVLRSPLKLVASDSLGRVYAAANGTRRLIVTDAEVRYVDGTVERKLYALNPDIDLTFAYTALGVYGDAPHGSPCDRLVRP